MVATRFKQAHILGAFGVCALLVGFARAQQPADSTLSLDANGQQTGRSSAPVQIQVAGRVLDAETGRPLPAFALTQGTLDRDRTSFDWAEQTRQQMTGGVFTLNLTRDKRPPAVLIEAEDYLPQSSGPIRALSTNMTFLLKKGSGPSGVLLTPAGQPAAGRTVYFSRLKDLIVLQGPKLTPKKMSNRDLSTVTDQSGRFSFAPDLDAFAIVAAEDEGFANVRVEDLQTAPQVRLQPWARVEGVLKIGTQPASNQTVRLADAYTPYANYPRPVPPYNISVETATDTDGRFVFPRVPPADVKIFHAPRVGRSDGGVIPITQITNLALKPGETASVTLGGRGRPVVGRVVLKNYKNAIDWRDQIFWIESIAPEPPDCPNFDAIDRAFRAARKAARSQQELDAAEARYLADHDRIARQLSAYYSSPTGRKFDVPGGKYELTLDLHEQLVVNGQRHSPLIALHRQEIEVPDCAGGRSDTPLDLGVTKMVAPLNPGEMAPDFEFKSLENKTLKLSDYLGRCVLLDFWAASDAASMADVPDLQETYAVFKNNPRFVMLGLSLDTNIESARAFSIDKHMDWPQGFLGPWNESAVPDQFGVEKLPLVVLIDPRGRVISSGLRRGYLKSAVDAALSVHE
jgi:peroxiredoxin